MLKLLKYLKPFAASILAAVVLVFIQAMCDLKLPDYMSQIVNIGIQQNGIADAVPEKVSVGAMEKFTLFFTEEERALMEKHYEVANNTYDDNGVTVTEEVQVYYLKDDLTKEDRETLADVFSSAGAAVASIETLQQDPEALKKVMEKMPKPEIPEGAKPPAGMDASSGQVDLFAMLKTSDEKTRMEIASSVTEQLDAVGQSMSTQMAIQYLQKEYETLHTDVPKIQRDYIIGTGLKMLLIAFLAAVSTVLVCLLSARIGAGFGRNLRSKVYDKVSNFSNAEFDKFTTSSLITRTTNDITQVQMLVVMSIRMLVYAPVMGIGGVIYALNKSVSMTWIIALGVIVLLGLVGTIMAIVMPRFKKMQTLLDRLNQVARENLSGLMVIRAYNTQKFEEDRFDTANKNLTDNTLFTNRVMTAMMPVMMLIMNCLTLLIIWVGAHQISEAAMQVGDMMAYMQYAMQIVMSFLMVSMMFIMMPRASVSGVRISEVLTCTPSIEDPKSAKPFQNSSRGLVEFKDVSFRFPGAEEDTLEHITFTARPGQTTAFIGSTGSGKSTLINLIPRFYDATQGEILVNGVNVREVSQHDLHEEIGYVPQKGVLFTGTIESNLKYGSADALKERVEQSVSIAQATDFIEEKPEKYDSPISQGGTNVSGGQKQRLSIARALVKNPPIYIFDDSFSALDFKTDAKLRRALHETTGDATILLVAQRVGTIRHAEQIIVLDEGKIVGKGAHEELMENCEIYREIAFSQLSKEELA